MIHWVPFPRVVDFALLSILWFVFLLISMCITFCTSGQQCGHQNGMLCICIYIGILNINMWLQELSPTDFLIVCSCECVLVFVLLYPSKCDIGCGVYLTGCRLATIWPHQFDLLTKYIFGEYFDYRYRWLSNP